jgi:hypothetical protein
MFGMRRREFMALLSGTAAWPLAARAQQGELLKLGLEVAESTVSK